MLDPNDLFADLIPAQPGQPVAQPPQQAAPAQQQAAQWQPAPGATQPADNAYFAPGGVPGAVPTAAQEAVARGLGPPTGAPGSWSNPTFDAPGSQAAPGAFHVTGEGQFVDPSDPSALFADLIPKTGLLEDFERSAPTALAHAATGVVGVPGDILDFIDQGVGMAYNAAAPMLGGEQATIDPRHHEARSWGGITVPDTEALNQGVEHVTGALYRPQTWAGRAVDTLGQFLPAALVGPEALGDKAASTLIPWAASDVAGEAAHAYAPDWEDTARMVGGIGGGLGVGAWRGPSGAAKVVNATSRGLSDADIQAGVDLGNSAAGAGVPLTMPEAMAQATGRGGQLVRAQQAVEGTQPGYDVFAPLLQARPGQMRGAVDNFVTSNFGPASATPSGLAPRAATAAETALTNQRQAINAQAAPYYAASRNDLVSPSDYAPLHSDPSYQMALHDIRTDPEMAPTVAGLPDNSVGVIDAAAKRLKTLAEQISGSEMQPGDRAKGGMRSGVADRAFAIAGASSPTYAQARQIVAQGHANIQDPLAAGPVGQISKGSGVQQQTGALFPSSPLPGSSSEVTDALSRFGASDPTLPAALVGSHLGQAAGDAFSVGRRGPDLYSGSTFARNVAGNSLQADNLRAGITAAASPQAASQFDDLTQALLATGQRLPARTATPEELAAALNAHPINAGELGVQGGVLSEAAHNPAGALGLIPLKVATKGLDMMNAARARGNAAELANTLTAPPDQWSASIANARTWVDRQRQMLAAALAGTGLQQAQGQR